MPTYEYECRACGHRFEKFQAMVDPPVRVCPACKKRRVSRLIGAGAGIIFKGSGFYETDYKRKSSSREKKESSGEKKESPGGQEKGSEAASSSTTKSEGKSGADKAAAD